MPSSPADGMHLADQDPPLETEHERPQARRIRKLRSNVQSLFIGGGRDAEMASEERSNSQGSNDVGSREGPKTPRFTITMPNLPSTRLIIPYLRRSTSNTSRGSRSNTPSLNSSEPSSNVSSALPSPSIIPSRPMSSEYFGQLQQAQPPEPVVIRDEPRNRVGRRTRRVRDYALERQAIGVGPEEQELAELASRGRRRRDRRKRRPTQIVQSRSRNASPPSESRIRRKRQAVKSKIVSCTASGLFLTMLLSIYLALALSNKIASQEFHIIIILVILVTTVFFCHSLIRLCIILVRPASDFHADPSTHHARVQPLYARGGYANPEQPIRVQLLRDEEAAGIESEVTKFPPPAYGLWRESVRVDPNRIYWARNTESVPDLPSIPNQHRQNTNSSNEPEEVNELERTTTTNRPPSYVSEDGVDYVIEAQGRSIAPPEPDSGITEMPIEHANAASRDYERSRGVSIDHAREASRDERRSRGISLSNAREVLRRERTSAG